MHSCIPYSTRVMNKLVKETNLSMGDVSDMLIESACGWLIQFRDILWLIDKPPGLRGVPTPNPHPAVPARGVGGAGATYPGPDCLWVVVN